MLCPRFYLLCALLTLAWVSPARAEATGRGDWAFDVLARRAHLGQSIVLLEPRFRGEPVFLEPLAAVVGESGDVLQMAGDLPRSSPRPFNARRFDDSAVRRAVEELGYQVTEIAGRGWLRGAADALEPVVLVHTAETSDLPPLALYLDPESGRALHTEPLRFTAEPMGAVFVENPVTTPVPVNEPLLFLDPSTDQLSGKYAHVETCLDVEECKTSRPFARAARVGDDRFFFYKPALDPHTFGDPFAEVNVYRNITAINHWIQETLGWEGPQPDQDWILVRVGRAWYNAAFYAGGDKTPPLIVFGQDIIDFAYDADVAYHEFGHAVNRTIWKHAWMKKDKRGIDVSPSAIEEALADAWAQNFAGDPVMDTYVERSRTADNRLSCVDTLQGEGHMEARFVSAFLWDVRSEIGAEPFLNIFYRALHLLPREPTFAQFASLLADTATSLAAKEQGGVGADHAAVIERAATARGLFAPQCAQRIVRLSPGSAHSVYGYGQKRTGGWDLPAGVQFELTAPLGAKAVRVFFTWRGPKNPKIEYPPGFSAFFRRGLPVEVTWYDPKKVGENEPLFSAKADAQMSGMMEYADFPTLEQDALKPGEKVYLLLASATKEPVFAVETTAYFSPQQSPPLSESAPVVPQGEPGDLVSRSGEPASCSTSPASARVKTSPLLRALLRAATNVP